MKFEEALRHLRKGLIIKHKITGLKYRNFSAELPCSIAIPVAAILHNEWDVHIEDKNNMSAQEARYMLDMGYKVVPSTQPSVGWCIEKNSGEFYVKVSGLISKHRVSDSFLASLLENKTFKLLEPESDISTFAFNELSQPLTCPFKNKDSSQAKVNDVVSKFKYSVKEAVRMMEYGYAMSLKDDCLDNTYIYRYNFKTYEIERSLSLHGKADDSLDIDKFIKSFHGKEFKIYVERPPTADKDVSLEEAISAMKAGKRIEITDIEARIPHERKAVYNALTDNFIINRTSGDSGRVFIFDEKEFKFAYKSCKFKILDKYITLDEAINAMRGGKKVGINEVSRPDVKRVAISCQGPVHVKVTRDDSWGGFVFFINYEDFRVSFNDPNRFTFELCHDE